MALRFQTFRQILCSILAFTAGASIALSIYIARVFTRRGFVWLLVTVEVLSVIRAVWSAIRKPIFGSFQSVASECISLFVLFPFHLIVALVISTIPQRQGDYLLFFMVLQGFAISGAIIHLVYTATLLLVATLTGPAFDRDIWLRDIDSSPSPFPIPIVFAFAFPCLAHRFTATCYFTPRPAREEATPTLCLPGCTSHMSKCPVDIESTNSDIRGNLPPEMQLAHSRPVTKPQSLVRLPNAAERRASIPINLEFR